MLVFKELPFTNPCYRNAGEPGDEFKYAANGSNLFRCACIARAGFEDFIDIARRFSYPWIHSGGYWRWIPF